MKWKSILLSALVLLTACSVPSTKQAPSPKAIPVIEYHGISTTPLSASYAPFSVDLTHFRQQMAYLHTEGYHSISPDQYVSWLDGKHVNLPAKPILITFDDGRYDSQLALPVLRHYHYRAVMFTVTGFADMASHGNKAWESWHELTSDGWYLQFHAGALGHLTPNHPYYEYAPLADSQKDIDNGVAEFTGRTGVVPQTWAVPNGAYTIPLLHWASSRFKVIWLEGHMPGHVLADKYHIRYRAEIANGSMESPNYFRSALRSPMYSR